MKTKREIKNKLKEHDEIRSFINSNMDDGEVLIFQDGFMAALKWVLDNSEDKE